MLGLLDSIIIVVSLLLVIGAVLRAAGKKQTDAEYFLAGRDLRWPFIGMSLLASNISAEHVVGLAGDGYRVGMVAGGFEWTAAWCLIILATLFAPLYLKSKIYTIPEFLGAVSAGASALFSLSIYWSSTTAGCRSRPRGSQLSGCSRVCSTSRACAAAAGIRAAARPCAVCPCTRGSCARAGRP